MTVFGVGRIGSGVKRKKQPNVALNLTAHKALKVWCSKHGLIAREFVSTLILKATKPE